MKKKTLNKYDPPVHWREWKKCIEQRRCTQCGKKLTHAVDSMTGKKSPYLFECKKCMPNIVISIG